MNWSSILASVVHILPVFVHAIVDAVNGRSVHYMLRQVIKYVGWLWLKRFFIMSNRERHLTIFIDWPRCPHVVDWLTALRHISTERLLVPRNVVEKYCFWPGKRILQCVKLYSINRPTIRIVFSEETKLFIVHIGAVGAASHPRYYFIMLQLIWLFY